MEKRTNDLKNSSFQQKKILPCVMETLMMSRKLQCRSITAAHFIFHIKRLLNTLQCKHLTSLLSSIASHYCCSTGKDGGVLETRE